jgi:hypothetical protein
MTFFDAWVHEHPVQLILNMFTAALVIVLLLGDLVKKR